MTPSRNPKKILNTWISSKRLVGRLNLTTRERFLKFLYFCDSQKVPDFKCPNEELDQWVTKVCNYSEWYAMLEELCDVRNLNIAITNRVYVIHSYILTVRLIVLSTDNVK